ncbi:MAG: endo-1,4-beta-xylanase [Bacteroidota bacterium]
MRPLTIIRRSLVTLLIVATAALSPGCDSVDAPPDDLTLRDLAERNNLQIGTAVEASEVADRTYADLIRTEFNSLTAGNAMKFGPLRPTINTFDWTNADAIVDFAESHRMEVRGHTLLWHSQNPSWLINQPWSRAQMIEMMRQHITTVVGRYRGRVSAWDVVNEAFNEDGTLRSTIWLTRIGPEYIEMAFDFANQADPDARLFINEYSAEGRGPKSDAVFNLVSDLRQRGVPVHGVGMQMHVSTSWAPPAADVAWNMNRLRELGVEVHITEMDVRMPLPVTDAKLQQQAQIYREMLDVCLEALNCTSFTIWGFTDLHSWIPDHFPGQGAALIFDEALNPKPAYDALRRALE